jgi:hypothetical protein
MAEPNESDRLTPKQHEDLYKVVRSMRLGQAKRYQDEPTAVILAGQPGAGKSAMRNAAMKELESRGGCVVLDPDQLRELHPNYRKHFREHPHDAASMVHDDSSALNKRSGADSARDTYHIVDDGTLGNPENAVAKVHGLRNVYEIDVRVVAVNARFSNLGISARYENSYEKYLSSQDPKGPIPRWVDHKTHDDCYKGMLESVQQIQERSLADRISVYSRGGVEIYPTANGQPVSGDARSVIEKERDRPFTPEEKVDLARGWDGVMKKARDRHAPAEEVESYIRHSKEAHLAVQADPAARSLYIARAKEDATQR